MTSRRTAALTAIGLLAAGLTACQTTIPGAPSCSSLPSNNVWHAPVTNLPVNARSAAFVSNIGSTAGLKADFGSGLWDGGPIGIPFTTVSGTQTKVPVTFDYASESDPGPYPIPANAPIEGGASSTGDRHVLVVDRDNCKLYELYSAYHQTDGSWHAGSGAVYDLASNALRPDGWTSADAAGLPVLPGLVTYDEVASGHIDHAIRITIPRSQTAAPLAGTSPGRLDQRPQHAADGSAAADQVDRRSELVPGVGAPDRGRAEDLRRDRRRQRLAVVHQRSAGQSVGQRCAAATRPHQGQRLAGGR